MAEYQQTSDAPGHTTIIERRSGGGAMLLAVVLLIVALIGGYFLLSSQQAETNKDNAIAGAAQSVSDTADKIGDAVSDGSSQ
ncbi:MAG: hypothetical protein AB7U35_09530 [Sphingobium sp.]